VLDYGMDDTTTLMLRFADGQTGSLTTLTATPDDWRVQVFGSTGWAEIRNERHLTVHLLDGRTKTLDFPQVDTAKEVLDTFARSLRTGTPWLVTPLQAIANTALLEAVVTSSAQQARVSIVLPDGAGEFE
jgi:predicted dehydrogenase